MRQEKRPGLTRPEGDLTADVRPVNSAHLTPSQKVRRCLAEARERLGGKVLASHFDGLDPEADVAVSTISKWETGARRFDLDNLPVLIALEPELGRYFLQMVPVWMGLPERALESLEPAQAKKVRDALAAVVFEEITPGRWSRR
jgi:hypothetical protein